MDPASGALPPFLHANPLVRPADPADPTYRHFERVVNLCVHGGVFAAFNSGLWFLQGLRHPFQHLGLLTLAWAAALLMHLLIVLRLHAKSAPVAPS